MTSLLESCRIAPPPGTAAEGSLPLTFFDIIWLHFHPIRRLLFYDFPCSKSYFLESLVPKLKQSLSQTLIHYFPLAGNCLGYGLGKTRHQDLVGPHGFFATAQAIGEEIKNRVNDKEKFMEGVENWGTDIFSIVQKRLFSVSGSAKVDLYSADFGWGKARKMETLSIDGEKYAMSLCKFRDGEGGLEIGLSLPKVKMDAFGALFGDGLIN